MARYTKVLKSLAHNAVGSKRIEAVSTSGSSISSLTYVPGSYHYVATQSNGTNITGNSQNMKLLVMALTIYNSMPLRQ